MICITRAGVEGMLFHALICGVGLGGFVVDDDGSITFRLIRSSGIISSEPLGLIKRALIRGTSVFGS